MNKNHIERKAQNIHQFKKISHIFLKSLQSRMKRKKIGFEKKGRRKTTYN